MSQTRRVSATLRTSLDQCDSFRHGIITGQPEGMARSTLPQDILRLYARGRNAAVWLRYSLESCALLPLIAGVLPC